MGKCGFIDAFSVTCNYIFFRVHIKIMYAIHPPPRPKKKNNKKQNKTNKQNAKKPL